MELPENVELYLSREQELEARLANAIELNAKMEKGNIVWNSPDYPELTVQADGQKSEYDEKSHFEVLSAELKIDRDHPEAGHYKVTVGPDGLLLTQPGDGMQEVVTDPERRKVLIGAFATKVQAAIESATRPEQHAKIIPFLKPAIRNTVELSEAA